MLVLLVVMGVLGVLGVVVGTRARARPFTRITNETSPIFAAGGATHNSVASFTTVATVVMGWRRLL